MLETMPEDLAEIEKHYKLLKSLMKKMKEQDYEDFLKIAVTEYHSR